MREDREILHELAVPPKAGGGTIVLVPPWQLESGEQAALLWTRAGHQLTWNKNRARGDTPSSFAQMFVPWLRLLGVEQPERVLRRAYERHRSKPEPTAPNGESGVPR